MNHCLAYSISQQNPRTPAILAVAKANNLDLEIVHTEPAKGVSTEYLKLNKLGKVPTFEGSDGYVLTECMAIAIYCKFKSLYHALSRQSKR
jgi:glutathione S-transferase